MHKCVRMLYSDMVLLKKSKGKIKKARKKNRDAKIKGSKKRNILLLNHLYICYITLFTLHVYATYMQWCSFCITRVQGILIHR